MNDIYLYDGIAFIKNTVFNKIIPNFVSGLSVKRDSETLAIKTAELIIQFAYLEIVFIHKQN